MDFTRFCGNMSSFTQRTRQTLCRTFLTEEALENIAETTAENLVGFFNGEVPSNELCYRCGRVETCKKERRERCF